MLSFFSSLPLSAKAIICVLIVVIASHVYTTWRIQRPIQGFPVGTLKGYSPLASWNKKATETLVKGLETRSGPFQIITGTGPVLLLPHRLADEVKSNDFDFFTSQAADFFVDYPGFDALKVGITGANRWLLKDMVRQKIDPNMEQVIPLLVNEMSYAAPELLGNDDKWRTTGISTMAARLVARETSRVFQGKDLCRNERWLQIATDHAIDALIAAVIMRAVPAIVRPVVHWVLPHNIRIRSQVRDASKLIAPEVERRQAASKQQNGATRAQSFSNSTSVEWMTEIAQGRPIDWGAQQLVLMLASVGSTGMTASRAIVDLCRHLEVVQPLRDEIMRTLREHNGWSKAALYNMKLLDSFLKESTRMHPLGSTAAMKRSAMQDVTLSDGTFIPKGTRLMVAQKYFDPTIYPEPHKFDAWRFVNEREKTGQTDSGQLVSSSSSHMLFGYGVHMCPGRFFAAAELKIMLAHLLLKYDWELDTSTPVDFVYEDMVIVNPKAMIRFRRRQEEILVDLPEKME